MQPIDYYERLNAEITGAHPVTGPYSPDDEIAAAQMNAENITEVMAETRVTELDILRVFDDPQDGHNALVKMEAASQADALLARTLQWLGPQSSKGLDVGNQSVRANIDAMAQAGVLTAAERDTIKGIAERQVSRASQLGLKTMKPGYIQKSRTVRVP